MTLNINMQDPAVARLLGKESGIVTPASGKPTMTQIAGDMDHGVSSTTRLDLGKSEVIVVGKEHVLTVDVYAIPGEPTKVHLTCPRCHHQLTIDGNRKAIDWNPTAPSPLPISTLREIPRELLRNAVYGVISVETFQCTWELEDRMQDAGKQDLGVIANGSLCRYRAVIDRNTIREV